MDDFNGATDRFLAWFKAGGGVFRDDLLEIQDLRGKDAGRGIGKLASQSQHKNIPEDTTLFTIPRDLIISVNTSQLPSKLPKVFDTLTDGEADDENEPLDSWTSLILVMIYEYLQGDASRWKPYMDVLPTTFDTPIFWSISEIKELQNTCLSTEKIGKQQSDEMLRSQVVPVVQQNPKVFYPDGARESGEEELLALAHRMGSTIMSYAFDLANEHEEEDEEEDGWVEDREVTSLRSTLPAGSEVLNYYGPLPNSELLRRYGYVTPEHHRYDVVELPWSLVREALIQELGLSDEIVAEIEAKLEEDEELEEYFIIERDSGEPDSEGQLTAVLKALKKSNPGLIAEKRKREDIFNAVVTKALAAKLALYPTSINDDERLLKVGSLEKRHRMAIEVRLGEKRLLHEALALLQGGQDEVKGQTGKKAKRKE
ncbi:unnamed protein product [Alternaria alternata]